MATEITTDSQDGALSVVAANESGDYVLWQRSDAPVDSKEIHFEWDDQSNGGYDLVSECSIDRDGIHIVLSDNRLVHFYFHALSKKDWNRFREHLEKMYSGSLGILDFYY